MLKILSLISVFLLFESNIWGQISTQTNLQDIEIHVVNDILEEGIVGVEIKIFDKYSDDKAIVGFTNEQGNYSVQLNPNSIYIIEIQHTNYFGIPSSELNLKESTIEPKKLAFELREITLGMSIRWDGINYFPNSHKINPSSQQSVDSLANFLLENQNVFFEINCHTDSRGNDEYNLKLTQKQAQSLVDYLIDEGIKSEHLKPAGYGESRLINHCRNKVRCTGAQHQENRRVELIILSLQ